MAIVQPTDFGAILARSPRLNEQGGAFAQIPVFNATLAAKMAGDTLNAKTELEALRIQGDNLVRAAKEQRKPVQSTFGDRLRAVAPALLQMGQSGGGLFGGGNRFAGDLLAQVLEQGSASPNALLGSFNDQLAGINLTRSQIEPWSAGSRSGTSSLLRMS
jgi:hypothetical protein